MGQQLYLVLVFCLLQAHTKPQISFGPEIKPQISFGPHTKPTISGTDPNSHFGTLNSEANQVKDGSKGPEAANDEPIKFPGLERPTTNNSSIKFPGPPNQPPATTTNGERREDRCNLPSETGWCRGHFEMWYFNVNSGDCEPFIYGGCEGNDNRFPSKEECKDVCLVKTVSGFP